MKNLFFSAVMAVGVALSQVPHAHANDYEDYQVEMETRQIYGDMERNRQHKEVMQELRNLQQNNSGCDGCAPYRRY